MSFGFRDKDRPSLRDRLRGKSGDQILEELRKKLDKDKEMFFDRVPNPPSFRRTGFPFDDDGLRARSRPDFRQRLEDLAQQHPEFADSLRPWFDQQPQQQQQQPGGDMGWGFRQRTGSSSSQSAPQPEPQQQDKPAEKPQSPQPPPQQEEQQQQPGLAHHGLRNTVDLGEAQAQAQGSDMDVQEQDERGKRAQSAPPAPDQAQSLAQGTQRFVSRLDVHPQPAVASQDPAAAKPPSGASKQQPQAGHSNVRQIPIFVEGRDEPVLARDDVDSSTNFGQSFGHQRGAFGHQGHQGFPRSNVSFPSFHGRDSHDQEGPAHKRPFPQQHHHQPPPPPSRQQAPQQQQTPQHHPPSPPGPQQPAPPPPTKPKDALEKVRDVQLEVDALSKQVEEFAGTRQDKQYLYLDEMLTRELIKLDVIETEGRDDVRAARKATIRSIQQCILRLEAKTATTPSVESMEVDPASATASSESMDVDAGNPESTSQASETVTTEAKETADATESASSAQDAPSPAEVGEKQQQPQPVDATAAPSPPTAPAPAPAPPSPVPECNATPAGPS